MKHVSVSLVSDAGTVLALFGHDECTGCSTCRYHYTLAEQPQTAGCGTVNGLNEKYYGKHTPLLHVTL